MCALLGRCLRGEYCRTGTALVIESEGDYAPAARYFQHLYDRSVVRASKILARRSRTSLRRYPHKLEHRFFRVPFSGSGEPYRLPLLHCDAAQDISGDNLAERVCALCCVRLGGKAPLEPSACVCADGRCGLLGGAATLSNRSGKTILATLAPLRASPQRTIKRQAIATR